MKYFISVYLLENKHYHQAEKVNSHITMDSLMARSHKHGYILTHRTITQPKQTNSTKKKKTSVHKR